MVALVGAILMPKCVQNGSSNGGPDVVLEGALYGGFNAGFESAP